MIESIISLGPSMKRRLPFDHEFMDEVGKGVYDLTPEQLVPVLQMFVNTKSEDDRYILIMSHMWLVRDLVCRFRAHFPETQPMTDDLVSVGIEAVHDFFDTLEQFKNQQQVFERLQAFTQQRMRDYINDNRCTFGASRDTNNRRLRDGKPLEYNFATEVNDELMGGEVNDPYLIDVLDSIEALNDVDAEEMRDLVFHFLKQNHNISEEELTAEEREALERLTEYVRSTK